MCLKSAYFTHFMRYKALCFFGYEFTFTIILKTKQKKIYLFFNTFCNKKSVMYPSNVLNLCYTLDFWV